jgi:hypothetical protein
VVFVGNVGDTPYINKYLKKAFSGLKLIFYLKINFTVKVIQDNYQHIDPIVQGSLLDLGDPCRRNF